MPAAADVFRLQDLPPELLHANTVTSLGPEFRFKQRERGTLVTYDIAIVDVPGDGFCGHHATRIFTYLATGKVLTIAQLRKAIADAIENDCRPSDDLLDDIRKHATADGQHGAVTTDALRRNFSELTRMARNTPHQAESMELAPYFQTIGLHFGMIARQQSANGTQLLLSASPQVNGQSEQKWALLYTTGDHWNLVVAKQANKHWSAPKQPLTWRFTRSQVTDIATVLARCMYIPEPPVGLSAAEARVRRCMPLYTVDQANPLRFVSGRATEHMQSQPDAEEVVDLTEDDPAITVSVGEDTTVDTVQSVDIEQTVHKRHKGRRRVIDDDDDAAPQQLQSVAQIAAVQAGAKRRKPRKERARNPRVRDPRRERALAMPPAKKERDPAAMRKLRERWLKSKSWMDTTKKTTTQAATAEAQKPKAKSANNAKTTPPAAQTQTKKAAIAEALAAGRTDTHVFGIPRAMDFVAYVRGDAPPGYDALADA